jgi:hypothetical protein
MFDEIYPWLESYAGVSFDFDESMKEIDGQTAIVEPFTWHAGIIILLEQLDDACNIIDTYWRAIPEGLPTKNKMKRMLTEHVFTLLLANIHTICNELNLDIPEVSTMEILKNVIEAMYDLLRMLKEHDTDEISTQNMYEDHEEANDDSFAEMLGVMKEDLPQLSMTVNAIVDAYYDSLDVDDMDNLS